MRIAWVLMLGLLVGALAGALGLWLMFRGWLVP